MAAVKGNDNSSEEKSKKEKGEDHSGHRERVFENVKNGRSAFFTDERLLEAMLFFSIPRCDTYKTAKLLIAEFGSLRGVFGAPISKLRKIPGVGQATAFMITLIGEIFDRLSDRTDSSERSCATNSELNRFLIDKIGARVNESMIAILLNSKKKIIHVAQLGGTNADCSVLLNEFLSTIDDKKAAYLVFAHNHPSNELVISYRDRELSQEMREIAGERGIEYIGGFIVGARQCIYIDAE